MTKATISVFVLSLAVLPMHVTADSRFALHAGVNYSSTDTARNLTQIDSSIGRRFSDTGVRVGASFLIRDAVKLEGGWARFGSEPGVVTTWFGCPPENCLPPEDHDVEHSGSGYWLAVVPAMQRGDFVFFCRLGAAYTSVKFNGIGAATLTARDTEWGVLAGAGIGYDLTDRFGLRLDVAWLGSAARTAGLGIEYRF